MYKNPNRKMSNGADSKSVMYWLVLSISIAMLVWTPFQKGLFNGNSVDFERPIYTSLIWASLLLAILAVRFFFTWKWTDLKDTISVFMLGIPLVYLIALIPAASSYNASNAVLAQIMYLFFFLVGAYLTKTERSNRALTLGIVISGYVIVIFGMMNWLGNGKLAGSLVGWFTELSGGVYRDAVMADANGLRLTSVFQYANTYAAYLIALLFSVLFLVTKSSKWYTTGLHALMAVPIVISFFLTLSRGAIVIIPFVLLIILFFQNMQRQIVLLLLTAFAFIGGLAILQKLTDLGITLNKGDAAASSLQGWTYLLVVSLLFAGLAVLIQIYVAPWLDKRLARFQSSRWVNISVPIAAVALGLICAALLFGETGVSKLLPENVRTRLENINFAQHSVLERGTFYKDAMKVVKDYPLLGSGGGGWSALYEKYQNNPYISRQAHSFFVQYLVEVGIIGGLIFLALLAAIFYAFIRSYKRGTWSQRDAGFVYFIFVISLLLHSMIDFDLSYVFVEMLLFLCLGAMVAGASEASFTRWASVKPAMNKIFPAVLLVTSLVVLFIAIRYVSANGSYQQFKQISQTSNDYNAISAPLDRALKLHPNHPTYAVQKIALLLQVYQQTANDEATHKRLGTELHALLESAKAQEPHNRQLIDLQIKAYTLDNKVEEATQFAAAELPNFTWDISMYEQVISLRAKAGSVAKEQGNTKEMDAEWNAAFDLYKEIQAKMAELELLPKEQGQGRAFSVTSQIALSLAQIDFFRGNYAASSSMLKPYVNDQFADSTAKSVARWYLAAIQLQGQNDNALYNGLIAKDASEKQNIDQLIQLAGH